MPVERHVGWNRRMGGQGVTTAKSACKGQGQDLNPVPQMVGIFQVQGKRALQAGRGSSR